jgi:hypothetical protein
MAVRGTEPQALHRRILAAASASWKAIANRWSIRPNEWRIPSPGARRAIAPLASRQQSSSSSVAQTAFGEASRLQYTEADMDSSGDGNLKEASQLKVGDFISWWGDRYVEILGVHSEPGRVFLTYVNPLTGVRAQSEYQPQDLVVVKKIGSGAA